MPLFYFRKEVIKISQSNGFNALFGITFEDYNSVKKKLDTITSKINSETAKGIKFNLDTEQITKTISDLSKLAKQNIQILPDGQITTLSKFNQELGKTITLKKNLTTGKETLSVDLNSDQIRKDTEKMYADLFKQQEEISAMQQKMTQQKRQQAEQEASEENRILQERYKAEQEFINASQKLKQKSSQEALKQAQQEANISNKILEDNYKEEENRKKEISDAQKLITYEKQRLEIRLQNIQSNRKGLTNDDEVLRIKEAISGISGNNVVDVKEKTKQLGLELQKLDQTARMKGLQVGNKSIMSFGESIKATATKLGIFVSTAMVLNQVQRTIRDATSYIIKLDESMVSLKKVTDETAETYDKFLSKMHSVALQLGTQSNLMVDATTNWAKTGKNLQEASKLAENTILLTKVGDVDNVNTAQQYMLPALQAFNIEADKSIDLINEYNNISNNMATTVNDVGEAMSKSASSMSVAGNSLEETIALIATAESVTQLGGNEIGTALKSLSMRLAQFKDEDGQVIPKLAEQIKALTNVDLTKANGQLKSTYEIYTEIGKVYKDLDQNKQLQLNEILGGKLRGNVVSAILNNVGELNRAYDLASDSANSALNEFETYQQGIEYSLDRLKEQMNGLYSTLLNGGLFKGLIDGSSNVISAITSINNTIGTTPTVMFTVLTSVGLFNTKIKELIGTVTSFTPIVGNWQSSLKILQKSLSEQATQLRLSRQAILNYNQSTTMAGAPIANMGKSLTSLNMQLAVVTLKLIATKVATIALQAVMSMGLSLAITAVVSLISGFVSSLGGAEKRIEDVNQKSKELSETLNSFKETKVDLSSYEKISEKLKDTTLSEKEKKDLNDQLLTVKEQLYTLDDSAYSILNNQNLGYQEQLDLLKQINDQKLYDRAEELDKTLGNGLWNQDESKNAENARKTLEHNAKVYKEIIELQKQSNGGTIQHQELGILNPDEQKQVLEQLKNQINDSNLTIQRYNSNVDLMKKANYDTDRSTVDLSGSTKSLVKEINESTNAIKNNTNAKEENANVDTGMSMEEATKGFTEAISKTKELQSMFDELNKAQAISPELAMKLLEAYPEIGSRITSVADTQEFLNQKISESVDAQRDAYMQMVANDDVYYNSKVKNNDSLQQSFNKLLSSFVTNSGKAYTTDLSNYKTLNDLKNDLTKQYGSSIASLITNFVSSQASGYDTDLDNTISWAKAKTQILEQLNKNITKIEDRLANSVTRLNSLSLDDENMSDAMKQYYANVKKLAQLKSQEAELQSEFDKYGANFKGYTPTFSGSDFSSGSTGSGSSSTEKEIKNMEKLSNRYTDVENALTQLNNELDRNKILMENTTDEEKLKYLDKELELIKKQEVAYKNKNKELSKELSELKNTLDSNGFNIGADGNVSNANQRLDALVGWANSLTGTAKENAQSNVKAIAEALERYNDLLLKQIPDVENKIIDLKNTTVDTQKEIVELIKKQKDSYIENIEKETDALKKEISKRKEMRSREWAEEDYADELKARQDTLVDLESQLQDAMRMADSELIANIKKQIESAQQDINSFIRDNERDKADQRYDDELEKIDEDTQKKIDEITNKLTDDEILKMVQSGVRDLTSVLDNIGSANKNVVTTFSTIDSNISNMRTNLSEVLKDLQSISVIDLNLNANVSGNISGKVKQPIEVKFENTYIIDDPSDDVTMQDVERVVKKSQDDTIKKFAEIAGIK